MTTYYDSRIDWGFIRGQEGDWPIGYVPNVKNTRGVIRSGTTVLFGYDLGQHDLRELKSLRLSQELEAKLVPYLKQKGADAAMAPQRMLEQSLDSLISLNNAQTGASIGAVGGMQRIGVIDHPKAVAPPGRQPHQFIAPTATVLRLELTVAEIKELTTAIQKDYYERLQRHFDAHRSGRKFAAQPVGVQTALLSLAWQTGNIWGHNHRAYSVFKAAMKENWDEVVELLRHGPLVEHANKSDLTRRRDEARLIEAAMKSDSGASLPLLRP